MLRIIQNTSAAGAKSYYSTADYYTEGQELEGLWRGEAAKKLGLWGKIQKEAWDALCDNKHPVTGELLTQRQKSIRRVGYDFNFHVPKSVSILYGMTGDGRILDAFRESVEETMRDMESEMKTRVRSGGRNDDRTTGNMVWGQFIHFTARPVDGIPDPHLHAHCFAMNLTFDDDENRWKAGQFSDLKRDAPYFEAVFHSRLAGRMADLGLAVERTKKGWELAGFNKATIDKFSRRTTQIEKLAREAGITDDHEKDKLGATTREHKQKNVAFAELQEIWRSRLDAAESDALNQTIARVGGPGIETDRLIAPLAAELAISHCFERNSVVPERKVLTEALKRSYGSATSEAVHHAVAASGLLTGERKGRRMATTRDVLSEEARMLAFAREGRGTCRKLGAKEYRIQRDWLNEEQRRAVLHVLNSNDRVIVVRGAAGVGKTTMMHEAIEGIEQNGHQVFPFAPSADASRGVLREQEHFERADTVARLLVDESLQDQIRGQVLWIDEAGLIGTRTMAQIFDLAEQSDARVVLSGDRRQHGSVERGAALRLLETEAGLQTAEIKEIQRQSDRYKDAVRALSEGRTEDGFRTLDELHWVRELPPEDRHAVLASDYIKALEQGSALVISPTHAEGEQITAEIRRKLKNAGRVAEGEREFFVLTNAQLTEAERRDRINYQPGDVLVYHQNSKNHRKGDRVAAAKGELPLSEAARFQVFHSKRLAIAPGDLLRIARNGLTADGRHRLNNGGIFTVKKFDADGNIVLTNGWTVGRHFGHLAHGYVVTSHSSQGKTVDRVLIGQSSQSLPATSAEQFYVSVSRGKKQATIYTDDKAALLDAAKHSDERLSATELVTQRMREHVMMMERERLDRAERAPAMPKGRDRDGVSHER